MRNEECLFYQVAGGCLARIASRTAEKSCRYGMRNGCTMTANVVNDGMVIVLVGPHNMIRDLLPSHV